ncbi:MBL fold metallo-hydrolase [Thermodesulfobacteriota bacterium]
MVIEKPGKVTDRIFLLGRRESNVYLLKGEAEYAILGGGMAYIVPEVMEQIKNFKIEEKKIRWIIILHSHFDHCGMVPFFKKRWPWVKIIASQRAKDLLSDPRVTESIRSFNQELLIEHGREKQAVNEGFEFSGIAVEDLVKEGDILNCGDLTMEVLEVPGHSSCSIAVYVPREKAMFASDAAGVPFGNHIFTAANSNFDKYQKSLERIAGYDIDVLLAEHYGARTGEDARGFMKKSMASAKKTRNLLEESYARTKDIEKSTEELTDRFMAEVPDDFLLREVFVLVIGQMLKYISRQM